MKRRRSDSNRCIKVLQTSPLPLGYGARHRRAQATIAWAQDETGTRDSNPQLRPWQIQLQLKTKNIAARVFFPNQLKDYRIPVLCASEAEQREPRWNAAVDVPRSVIFPVAFYLEDRDRGRRRDAGTRRCLNTTQTPGVPLIMEATRLKTAYQNAETTWEY